MKYLNKSYFDNIIEKTVNSFKNSNIKVLDLGGGKLGTQCLKKDNIKAYLLDPNIENIPEWMYNFTWFDNEDFDLIIARGSLNYLNDTLIKNTLTNLKTKGIFIANSFLDAPEPRVRRYKNSNSDTVGTERINVDYNKEGKKIIKHELIPMNGDEIIKHEFFVYTINDIINLIDRENYNISFHLYGKNSYYTKIVKE